MLIDDTRKDGNPWGVSFMAMFRMSNDSGRFRTAEELGKEGFNRDGTDFVRPAAGAASERFVPLYEAKWINQFDHRWATYEGAGGSLSSRDVTLAEKADPSFEPAPRYFVPSVEVDTRLVAKSWSRGWLMGWRDIRRSTDERTVIAPAVPRVAVGHTSPLFFVDADPTLWAILSPT